MKEFKTERRGAAQRSERGARDGGALCPRLLGGKEAKPDAVFLTRRAGYFCVQTHRSEFLTEGERVCLHPSPSFPLPEVPGSTGVSSVAALRAGGFSHISAVLRRGLPRQTPGHLIYFWLNTGGCHYHLCARRSISASKRNQPIASLSPIILHSGLLTFGHEEEGLFFVPVATEDRFTDADISSITSSLKRAINISGATARKLSPVDKSGAPLS